MNLDIKPENIGFDDEGRAKIIDIATAVPVDENKMARPRAHTEEFSSPELVRQRSKIDGRSDLYSLAATMFAMFTFRTEHLKLREGFEAMEGDENRLIPFNRKYAKKLSDQQKTRVSQVIGKGLMYNPVDRYSTAGEMAEAFRGI